MTLPLFPHLLGELLPGVAVEELPEVLIKIDGLRRKGFVITVVVLNPSLVYDNLGVLNHAKSNILFTGGN